MFEHIYKLKQKIAHISIIYQKLNNAPKTTSFAEYKPSYFMYWLYIIL